MDSAHKIQNYIAALFLASLPTAMIKFAKLIGCIRRQQPSVFKVVQGSIQKHFY